MQVIRTPLLVTPFAPAGEQNAPGVTGFAVVDGGFAVVGVGFFAVVGGGFAAVGGGAGVAAKGGGAVALAVGSGCEGQVANTLAMASCSARVTQRRYVIFTATWRATNEQRKALLGGSQLAASESPFFMLMDADTASKFRGSLAKFVRIFKVNF